MGGRGLPLTGAPFIRSGALLQTELANLSVFERMLNIVMHQA